MGIGVKYFLHSKIMAPLKLELDLIDKFLKALILGAFVRKTGDFSAVVTIHILDKYYYTIHFLYEP